MSSPEPSFTQTPEQEARLRIYCLPNLLTAGNLFCGFLALTKIVEADPSAADFNSAIRHAMFYILLACIFDLLDGRVARLGGYESPFGREFDSLADLVSFGVAPAFLVHRIVLRDVFVEHPEVGWFLASIYLICGALRLARFNCLAAMSPGVGSKQFLGFPIPAAAGLVASLTLFLLWWDERNFQAGFWRYALPVLMIFLSFMMVSHVRYPSFKAFDWRTSPTFTRMVIIIMTIGFFIILRNRVLPIVLPFVFGAYLVYGFARPFISSRIRHGIEDDDEPPAPGNGSP
ncbi:MAG TPA: CDP-diacylglycerol--serine O-phosphatidyltransferase [Candidatus Paceibacterota bacterium]|nr:CDP-diacylglycerol--serine O-phosphatidyltransferase [Verrucomicrobiota bacterium]HRZ44266.1 CDP-diacylglycerol--serine O-phosphatidyltransferase [Candidatus Paceibacterota bacterium]HRZ94718.1 CDP-diacylglycerol--serine O-phosphatidyltransferase [Candidatus Paceibacterota bacterium]